MKVNELIDELQHLMDKEGNIEIDEYWIRSIMFGLYNNEKNNIGILTKNGKALLSVVDVADKETS